MSLQPDGAAALLGDMSLLPVSISGGGEAAQQPLSDPTAVTRQHSKHSSYGSTAGTSQEGSRKPDLRLLIVEDDEFVQMALRVMLETIAEVIGSEKPPPSPACSPTASHKPSPSLKTVSYTHLTLPTKA